MDQNPTELQRQQMAKELNCESFTCYIYPVSCYKMTTHHKEKLQIDNKQPVQSDACDTGLNPL